MSRSLAALGAVVLLAAPLCAEGAAERAVAGQLKDLDAWKTLGRQGCLVIRSQARWEAIQKLLTGMGWERPTPDPLASVDFAREHVVCLFRSGDEADRFAVRSLKPDPTQAELHVVMSYVIYKSHAATPDKWNFLLVALPQSPSLKVTVGTYHPMNGGPYPTPDKALLEWSATLTPDWGDIVDGLRGAIRAEKPTIAPGEDIPVEFRLEFDTSATVKPGRFALKPDSARVWDNQYSEGYRNHAFLVETPDGKCVLLRRPEQLEWRKNIPHPVQVAAGKPYVLPGSTYGSTWKSLKALGLDATKPGTYRITGLYMESADAGRGMRQLETIPFWGGNLATNTIQVTVKAASGSF